MLSRIYIQNFALIDQLEINFKKGLQVITGETGAGKSIILGALRLILGERADSKSISDFSTKSVVEAEFKISESLKIFFEENDLDFEKDTIIRREILPSGKSRAFVNDVPVTLDVLKELSERLIDIHSQFETSQLFSEEYQFKIIDGLSENKNLIESYQSDYLEFQRKQRELEKLKNTLSEGNKESDYKLFLLEELEAAQLETVNYELLQSQISLAENKGAISELLAQIFARTDQEEVGLFDGFYDVKNKLSRVADLSLQFSELNARLEENYVEFKDILFQLQNEAEKLDANPEDLLVLQEQNDKINALFLKHKVSDIEDLLKIKEELSLEKNSFEDIENKIAQLEKEIAEASQSLLKKADILSKNRKKTAPIFVEKVESLLHQLGLEKAKVEVELSSTKEFGKFGTEKIQLLFQANAGFALKPIQNAISGGERSRVMLSIKKLMAENAELPTLILDEIDTGVSGRIADEMGNVMQEMAENMQLIVITHLAQVAAKGNDNYKVQKSDIDGKTQTRIFPLNQEEKLTEIAQLLSGSKITDAAILQAKELMQ
ncbi:DNA repair protein RecN [Cloacibacterium normanense]|uniref:DNA repair protein RecN n=1 Tax=Cloacibacterium normanense TaxID=237258 RepID=A0A1E5UBL9_9FLAO|nr:DNA repair protein RecN [Cloacibacterium normanense]AZI70258.1 DNA repair protein RecN [Cloacibacterium normanense]OEL10316.1 DNA repair protein RecN [Cloacibacterium normanense]SDO36294.1 DNA repair protein RecN (Recombination protein N) [Cloacibacterium normanense]